MACEGRPRSFPRPLPALDQPASRCRAQPHRRRKGEVRQNLPAPLTSFIGREQELAAVSELLGTARLLTLTGAPGVGKTRLALQVATAALDAFADGVWQVELASLAEPTLVLQAVARAVGVREHPGRPLLDALVDALHSRQMLLVLDNCEHLVAACASLAEDLLRACPHLTLLTTSREALGIGGETTWRVPSLALPGSEALPPTGSDPVSALLEYEAVRLFVERARSALPTFTVAEPSVAALAQVCHRLDGIPLALELAAPRVRVLTVEQLSERLDDRFRLLTCGRRTALPRQQTLRAAVDWSYDLLSEPERILFRRLSVFAGGWSLEAAEGVCAGEAVAAGDVLELLAHLVDKSLVVAEQRNGEMRYRLLQTLQHYGAEKLREAGEEARLRDRHLAWFAALGEQADPLTWGPSQLAWFERGDAEVDNLRAALAWSQTEARGAGATASADDRAEAGLRLGWAVVRFWETRGYLSEGRRWLTGTLAHPLAPTPARAKALNAAAYLTHLQGAFAAARALLDEALTVAEAAGDPFSRALAVQMLGAGATAQGDLGRAATLLEQPLPTAAEVGHAIHYYVLKTASLLWRGELALVRGEYARARALFEEVVALGRGQGDRWSQAHALGILGHLALLQGDYPPATTLRQESLRLWRELRDNKGIGDCLEGLAWAAAAAGRAERAARLFGAAEATRDMTGFAMSPQHHWWGAEHRRMVTATRARLGEDACAAAWAEGQAMPLGEAVAYALAADQSPPDEVPASTGLPRPVKPSPAAPLSERERAVARLVARGLTNRQVADELVITAWTVQSHLRHILRKLGLRSRAQVAAWAVEQGLFPPAPRG